MHFRSNISLQRIHHFQRFPENDSDAIHRYTNINTHTKNIRDLIFLTRYIR